MNCVKDVQLDLSSRLDTTPMKDVLRPLDAACSGRSSCFVSVRSLVELHPCQPDFVSYLEAGYQCVEGQCSLYNNNNNNKQICIAP